MLKGDTTSGQQAGFAADGSDQRHRAAIETDEYFTAKPTPFKNDDPIGGVATSLHTARPASTAGRSTTTNSLSIRVSNGRCYQRSWTL